MRSARMTGTGDDGSYAPDAAWMRLWVRLRQRERNRGNRRGDQAESTMLLFSGPWSGASMYGIGEDLDCTHQSA